MTTSQPQKMSVGVKTYTGLLVVLYLFLYGLQ